MKKNFLEDPDAFSSLPLLTLLSSERKLNDLRSLGATLHARFESVLARKELLEKERGSDSEQMRVALAEYAMLSQALDWLSKSGQ